MTGPGLVVRCGSVLSLAWTLACGGSVEPRMETAQPGLGLDLSGFRLVDLSHTYDESTLYWPTSPSRFESETLFDGFTDGGYYYFAKQFATPEHGGTHLDAPAHFAQHGWKLDEIPLQRLVAPAVVIDVSREAEADSDHRLSRDVVLAWEAEHGAILEGSIVFLRTGWARFWSDEKAYYGRPEGGETLDLHFPAFGEEAARLLVKERRVGMLGVDSASIDYGASQDFIVHQVASGANVPGLENVANLDQLPATGAWVVALPMKVGGGSGAPVRILGLVPR